MAKAGYGKRDAPDQAPRRADDFAGLEPREAAIAGYIDRLPEGAAIGYKVLAEELPDYGQQACRSALDRLTRAGHLRRIRIHLAQADGRRRWVTRTYFSRTARDADWWAAHVRFVRGLDAPGQPPPPAAAEPAPTTGPAPAATPAATTAAPSASAAAAASARTESYAAHGACPAAEPAEAAPSTIATATTATTTARTEPEREPEPGVRAPRSEAYALLAGLGGREPRLQLSDGECVQLEHLVGEWLARGAGREQITRALTSGLPTPVHSAGHFLRKRLETKMPLTPAPVPENDQLDEYVIESVIVCLFCDEDETTTTLDHGVCADCSAAIARDEAVGLTGDVPDTFLARPRPEVDVAARMAELRSAAVRPVLPSPRPRR
ncbi:hypothetical protein B1H20_15360 [Streptomyces violaceoruber]|uniref:Uncharacterized protein n=1 Tax=Streptomyces violaceoruber TaxID=1935 RepID=A0A1V0UBI3_STRVN|nr:hypothetical protein [Streptomyces violaceoruber]ARF62615.1 hypothetical protein B1H20_15360 [Streptomyces violaceoruber]